MSAPGYSTTVGDRGATSPDPGDVGGLAVVVVAEKGPVDPQDCRSLQAVKDLFGGIVGYSTLIKGAEAYFRDGGSRLVVKRAVGPTPVTALAQIPGASGNTLVATAPNAGAWANGATGGYSVDIVTGTSGGVYRVLVLKFNGVEVERTGEFNTRDGLVGTLPVSGVVITAGAGSGTPTVAAGINLATGDDDHGNITTAQWQAGLDAINETYGPMSVAVPGITTTPVHTAILAHAKARNRFGLLDSVDTATVATHTAEAATLRALDTAPYGQLLAPWEKVPSSGTTTVTIPPCYGLAGRLARADRENLEGPGQYAAGRFGISQYAVDVTQPDWSDAERDTLNLAGVTVIRNIRFGGFRGVQAYGFRTIANPDTLPQYTEAPGMRVLMAIRAEGNEVLAGYFGATIDGKRHKLGELEKDLVGIGLDWYGRDALYGEDASDAFQVDVGPGVNPDAQLAARKIAARLLIRTSPGAERVELIITKVAAGDTI